MRWGLSPSKMNMDILPNKKTFRPDEIADIFDVSRKTVYNWIKTGYLQAVEDTHPVRVSRESIERSWAGAKPDIKPTAEMIQATLNSRIAGALRTAMITGNARHDWGKIVGYNVEELKRHLERRFTKGMSWKRFLAGEIHIDHKIPKSLFNFTRMDHLDFKRCWALENLRPMWARENIQKGARLRDPFQPGLPLKIP